MNNCYRLLFVSFALTLSSSVSAQTVLGWWRIEGTSGSIAGNPTTPNVNSSLGVLSYLKNDGAPKPTFSSNAPLASLQSPTLVGTYGASSGSVAFSGTAPRGNVGLYYTVTSPAIQTIFNKSSYSLEAWILPTDTSNAVKAIFGIGYPSSSTTYGFEVVQNGSNIELRTGTTTIPFSQPAGLSAAVWSHIALYVSNYSNPGGQSGTLSGSIFVDGTSIGTFGPTSIDFGATASYFTVGESGAGSVTWGFLGNIDEVRYMDWTGVTFDPTKLDYNFAAVPEPSVYAAIFGLVGLGAALWHRRSRIGAH